VVFLFAVTHTARIAGIARASLLVFLVGVFASGCRHAEPVYRLEPTKACLQARGLRVVEARQPDQPLPMLGVRQSPTGELRHALVFHSHHRSAAQAVETSASGLPDAAVGNVQLVGDWNDPGVIRSCLKS
jgi:hypothetical protein